jgi:hypothetical protein
MRPSKTSVDAGSNQLSGAGDVGGSGSKSVRKSSSSEAVKSNRPRNVSTRSASVGTVSFAKTSSRRKNPAMAAAGTR